MWCFKANYCILQIDEYEQFLFRGVMAYAVQKYCGEATEDDELAQGQCPTASGDIGYAKFNESVA